MGWRVEDRPVFPSRKHASEVKLTELGNLSEAGADVKADPTAVIPKPITQSSRGVGMDPSVSVLAASEGRLQLLLILESGVDLGSNSASAASLL